MCSAINTIICLTPDRRLRDTESNSVCIYLSTLTSYMCVCIPKYVKMWLQRVWTVKHFHKQIQKSSEAKYKVWDDSVIFSNKQLQGHTRKRHTVCVGIDCSPLSPRMHQLCWGTNYGGYHPRRAGTSLDWNSSVCALMSLDRKKTPQRQNK